MSYVSQHSSILQFARLNESRTLFVMHSTTSNSIWWCVSKKRELLGIVSVDEDENYAYQRV